MDAEIFCEAHFFNVFFRMRLRIDLGSIFLGSEPENHRYFLGKAMIFATGISGIYLLYADV